MRSMRFVFLWVLTIISWATAACVDTCNMFKSDWNGILWGLSQKTLSFGCSLKITSRRSVSWWVLNNCALVKDSGLLAVGNYNFHWKQILLRMWKEYTLIRKGRTRLYLRWQLSERAEHFKVVRRLNFTLFGSHTVFLSCYGNAVNFHI